MATRLLLLGALWLALGGVAFADDAPVCFSAPDAQTVCVPLAAVRAAFGDWKDGEMSAWELSRIAARAASDETMIARAALAACQAELGPLETAARKADSNQGRASLRAEYDAWHPGWTLDDNARPVKKLEPKK